MVAVHTKFKKHAFNLCHQKSTIQALHLIYLSGTLVKRTMDLSRFELLSMNDGQLRRHCRERGIPGITSATDRRKCISLLALPLRNPRGNRKRSFKDFAQEIDQEAKGPSSPKIRPSKRSLVLSMTFEYRTI